MRNSDHYDQIFYHLTFQSVRTEVAGKIGFLRTCGLTDGVKWPSVRSEVGASGFEPLASRTRTVRSIRAELRPAKHDYTTA